MKALTLILGCIFLVLASSNSAFITKPSISKAGLAHTASNVDDTTYTDFDLHKLIMNNLGLLSDQKLTQSNQKIINKYGEKILSNRVLLNYLFLIDAEAELLTTRSIQDEHQSVKLNACEGEDADSCILNLLYDSEREDSVVSEFETAYGKAAHIANHFFTSNPLISHALREVSHSIRIDANGNAIIVENRSGRTFPTNKNLSKCANDVIQTVARLDVANGVIYVKSNSSDTTENTIILQGEGKEILRAFAEEICTIVSMPRFILKDPVPALFSFYVSTMRDLQNLLKPEEKGVISKAMGLAYKHFKDVIKSKFGENQVAGQVVLTNNTKRIESQIQEKFAKQSSESSTRPIRILQDTTTTTTTTDTLSSMQVLFRIFGVGFVIVLAIILVALSSIQVEKDSLVYSKFLTVDQRK